MLFAFWLFSEVGPCDKFVDFLSSDGTKLVIATIISVWKCIVAWDYRANTY